MRSPFRTALVGILMALAAGSAPAAELYVTDQLEITLRSGPSLNNKILRMLTSGTPLQKLQEAEGWAEVRTPSGDQGWVVVRYLTTEPPKGPRLEAAQRELAKLRDEVRKLQTSLETARTEGGQASGEARRLGKRLETVEKEFAAWKKANQDVIAIRERAERLEAEHAAAQQELEQLKTENRSLRAREKFYWFFSGVIVLLVGWTLGYLYCSSRNRARSQARFRM